MHRYDVRFDEMVELLHSLSIVVGEGLPYSWTIAPDQEYLQVYLTDTADNADVTVVVVDLDPIIPDTPLPAPPAMNASSLTPATASIAGPDFMLLVTGTQFSPSSTVVFGGEALPTTFVSTVQLATVISPNGATAGTVNVQVQDGSTIVPTTPLTFTWSA